jgi:hypothetical protein
MDMKECEFGEQVTVKGDGKIRKTHWAYGLNLARNVMGLYLQKN